MHILLENLDLYTYGVLVTLKICGYSIVGSFLLGVVMAAFRISPISPLRLLGAVWVQAFQNCPLPVVLYFIAFGLPTIGINAEYLWFGVAGLTLYTSAFVAEAVRSGFNAVPKEQWDAARSIGLTFTRSLLLVVLPQALRSAIPPLVNVVIMMIKNAAVVGAFGVAGELFSVANALISAKGEPPEPVLLIIVAGYLLLIIPLSSVLRVVERRAAILR